MVGLVISDRFILAVNWEYKTSIPEILNIEKIPFNQSILSNLSDESELNIILSSVLKKINQKIPFYNKEISVAIIDDLVHHSVVENEIDISNDDMFNYISGRNEDNEKIKMTTPVTQFEKNGNMSMQFYLPYKFNSKNAPKPTKAGTKYTPLLLLSDLVTFSVSLAFLINFSLSLAH